MVEFAKHLEIEVDDTWESPVEIVIEDFVLTFAEFNRTEKEELLMYASLGVVPEDRELEIYRGLLEANVLWSGTADATLGVNSATREVIIAYRVPMEGLTGEILTLTASYFSAVAMSWYAFVAGELDESEPIDFEAEMAGVLRV
ncbi:MAG: type III secretion system chaperone [Planctomycetota bacterium]